MKIELTTQEVQLLIDILMRDAATKAFKPEFKEVISLMFEVRKQYDEQIQK